MPLMNVARRLPNSNIVNPAEPHAQRALMTSAGSKSSYAYMLLLDFLEQSIIAPETTFVMGFDVRVPLMHGLIDKEYIQQLKSSSSYDDSSFNQEYMSLWGGSDKDSWYQFEKMAKYRKLLNPETTERFSKQGNQFYLISVDIGRIHDSTIATIYRVNVRSGRHYTSVVNIVPLGLDAIGKTFMQQAIDLKMLIRDFNPKEIVIDTNGLGIGLAEELTRTQYGPRGEALPPIGFINDEVLKKTQPADAPLIGYGIKATAALKSEIDANAFARIRSGLVQFLIDEREARNYLLSTKIGQDMSLEKRVKRLLPHEMTTKLFLEMSNLKLKDGSGTNIRLEKINTRYSDDKYASFSYGLWRIKELEEIELKKYRKAVKRVSRKLTFYTEARR